ncbi:hypothetical protein [Streptosporangium vulgare]|uniref:hypothetical protein n=1 Tax=Streptosporangium vulgare TaxID=46190 RepID=UPI0031E44EF8
MTTRTPRTSETAWASEVNVPGRSPVISPTRLLLNAGSTALMMSRTPIAIAA